MASYINHPTPQNRNPNFGRYKAYQRCFPNYRRDIRPEKIETAQRTTRGVTSSAIQWETGLTTVTKKHNRDKKSHRTKNEEGKGGFFSLKDLGRPAPDPSPIIEKVNTTSTAGFHSILSFCELSGMSSKLLPAKYAYKRGWGPTGAPGSPVIAAWELMVQYMDEKPVEICFDVTQDDSPIILGMDVKRFSITTNVESPTYM